MTRSTPLPARPRRRPRNSLTLDAILDAAEALAADGLATVTMRAVANELEASPMALYRYVATKDELVDALLDRVLGRFVAPPATRSWSADLGAFARAHRKLLVDHPWAVTVLFTHPSPGVNAVVVGETALAILARGGIEGVDGVVAFSTMVAFNYGWCAFAVARDPARSEGDRAPDLGEMLRALPGDAFPLTLGVADAMASYGSDEHYERALGSVLSGVASLRPVRHRPARAAVSGRAGGR